MHSHIFSPFWKCLIAGLLISSGVESSFIFQRCTQSVTREGLAFMEYFPPQLKHGAQVFLTLSLKRSTPWNSFWPLDLNVATMCHQMPCFISLTQIKLQNMSFTSLPFRLHILTHYCIVPNFLRNSLKKGKNKDYKYTSLDCRNCVF